MYRTMLEILIPSALLPLLEGFYIMAKTGTVFSKTESQCATIEVDETPTIQRIIVKVNGNPVILFPLPLSADTNQIALRTMNVVNQTGLVENPVRVEMIET